MQPPHEKSFTLLHANHVQWLTFPCRVSDLPLDAKLVFRVVRDHEVDFCGGVSWGRKGGAGAGGGSSSSSTGPALPRDSRRRAAGVFYAELNLFQETAVLRQGRQLLILSEERPLDYLDGDETGVYLQEVVERAREAAALEPRGSADFVSKQEREEELMLIARIKERDKLLDLAERGLLASDPEETASGGAEAGGGGSSKTGPPQKSTRDHIVALQALDLARLDRPFCYVRLPTYAGKPILYADSLYLSSVASTHVFVGSEGGASGRRSGRSTPGRVSPSASKSTDINSSLVGGTQATSPPPSPTSLSSRHVSSASSGGGLGGSSGLGPFSAGIPFTDLLADTYAIDDPVREHRGLGFSDFVPLLDYELEGNFEHPSHLKYMKLQRGTAGGAALRPNAEELVKLNEIVRRPKKQFSGEDRLLIYKFRHTLMEQKEALTKFLLVVDWQDGDERDQALALLPKWTTSPDADIALELLGKEFIGLPQTVRQYAVGQLGRRRAGLCQ